MKQADPRRHPHAMRLFQFFILLIIAPDDSHAAHHIINDKIPVICPVEHTDQEGKYQYIRICQGCCHLFFTEVFLSCCLCLQRTLAAVMFHHRINQTDQRHHEHQINHMGMQISQHK